MSQHKNAVLVTTTFAKAPDDFRFGLAKKTIQAAVGLGYQIIVVDGSPDPQIRDILKSLGAEVYEQEEPGMGNSRRQAFQAGLDSEKEAVSWLEPEKYPLVPLLGPSIEAVVEDGYDLVVPRRKDALAGYPPYQQRTELIMNHLIGNITGRPDLDLTIGPRVIHRDIVADVFLEYTEEFARVNRLDDNWGILFFPILQLLNDGYDIRSVVVDYVHPPEQTAAEMDSPEMNLKRDKQRDALVEGMQRAAEVYGFKTPEIMG